MIELLKETADDLQRLIDNLDKRARHDDASEVDIRRTRILEFAAYLEKGHIWNIPDDKSR